MQNACSPSLKLSQYITITGLHCMTLSQANKKIYCYNLDIYDPAKIHAMNLSQHCDTKRHTSRRNLVLMNTMRDITIGWRNYWALSAPLSSTWRHSATLRLRAKSSPYEILTFWHHDHRFIRFQNCKKFISIVYKLSNLLDSVLLWHH